MTGLWIRMGVKHIKAAKNKFLLCTLTFLVAVHAIFQRAFSVYIKQARSNNISFRYTYVTHTASFSANILQGRAVMISSELTFGMAYSSYFVNCSYYIQFLECNLSILGGNENGIFRFSCSLIFQLCTRSFRWRLSFRNCRTRSSRSWMRKFFPGSIFWSEFTSFTKTYSGRLDRPLHFSVRVHFQGVPPASSWNMWYMRSMNFGCRIKKTNV